MPAKSISSPETAYLSPPRTYWKTAIGVLVMMAAVCAAYPWLVGPPCPRKVVIATGSRVGAYYAFAHRYQPILEAEGIQLEIRPTAGSVENASLLQDSSSDVSLAIMQGGTAGSNGQGGHNLKEAGIQSLASLFLEPLWVFYRGKAPITRLGELRGKRVSVGAPGSGTRALALDLLADNGFQIDDQDPGKTELPVLGEYEGQKTQLSCQGSKAAAESLKAGKIDAAFFVLAPTAPLIRELLKDPEIQLLNFDRAEAYKRRHPYLTSVTLSEGMLDLKRNLPRDTIELLAPTAVLVAREDLHPSLVPLFLKAASEVHEAGGILESPREFPSETHIEYPINADARSFLRTGPSFLYRQLPFSVAAWVDRMKLMIVPLCTLLIPLIKAAPPLYRWRIRSKIYTWYRVLREVDQTRKDSDTGETLEPLIKQLRQAEQELAEITVPLSFMEEFYNLRWHVAFVLEQLESQQENTSDQGVSQPEDTNRSDIRQIPHLGLQIADTSRTSSFKAG